ncbi:MAG: hypothetical protein LBG21_01105 [Campylobacteraceae bacterium]|jgi:hypothetical protein|nr:hypothetical protein [Campylobacteraceae bacterium]
MTHYTESHSLEESLEKLKKYKDKISDEIYSKIESGIWDFAQEDMYCDEKDIENSIAFFEGKKTREELITEIRGSFKQVQVNK